METSNRIQNPNFVVQVIRAIGVLCFIASGLSILPWNYAVLAGIACFLIAPVVRQFLESRVS
mgnify:CR=1 FL=1